MDNLCAICYVLAHTIITGGGGDCVYTYQLCRLLSSLVAQTESVFVRLILDFLPSLSRSLMEWALLITGSKFLPNEEQRSLQTDRRYMYMYVYSDSSRNFSRGGGQSKTSWDRVGASIRPVCYIWKYQGGQADFKGGGGQKPPPARPLKETLV